MTSLGDKLKMAAGAVAAGAVGFAYADSKLHLRHDLAHLTKLSAILGVTRGNAGKEFTVADMWAATLAKVDRSRNCLVSADDGTAFTFDDVERESNKVAHWLLSTGLKARDVVALFMENRPEYVITWLGMTKAGIVCALINSNNKRKPLLHSFDVADCKAVVFGTELSEAMADVQAELEERRLPLYGLGAGCPAFAAPADAAVAASPASPVDKSVRAGIMFEDTFGYIYTSGTTGLPKACIIKHVKVATVGSMMTTVYDVTDRDVLYTVLPLYHTAGGLLGAGCCVLHGVTMVVTRKFSARNFFKHCAEHKVTVTQYIGELCRYLLNSPETEWDRKHHVRIAIGNGLRREIWTDFQKRFNIPEIGEFYGATEGNVAFVNHSKEFSGVGAMGRSGWLQQKIMGFRIVAHDVENEVPVRGPDGRCVDVPHGTPGELLGFVDDSDPIKKFEGYTSKEATDKKLIENCFKDGDKYFTTGDLVRMEPDGYVYFVDRIGDTFRWKGENVSTNEVGEVVSIFPGVIEANIYGVQVPGNMDGRACMAAIVVDGGKTPDMKALADHVTKDLASYAVPQFVRLLPEMESTGTFKQRKVNFVKDGIDIAKVSDPLYWFNAKSKTYEPLGPAEYGQICQGTARL